MHRHSSALQKVVWKTMPKNICKEGLRNFESPLPSDENGAWPIANRPSHKHVLRLALTMCPVLHGLKILLHQRPQGMHPRTKQCLDWHLGQICGMSVCNRFQNYYKVPNEAKTASISRRRSCSLMLPTACRLFKGSGCELPKLPKILEAILFVTIPSTLCSESSGKLVQTSFQLLAHCRISTDLKHVGQAGVETRN